jgi:hypothetical protein
VNVEEILDRLVGVRRNARGWTARCPAHPDKSPSLSIHEVEGKILLHCFSHCTFSDVVAAIGLEERDLFTEPRTFIRSGQPAYVRKAIAEFRKKLTRNEADLLDVTAIVCDETTVDQAAARAFVLAVQFQELAVIVLRENNGGSDEK